MDKDQILQTYLLSAMTRSLQEVAPWATQTAINKAVQASSEAAIPVLQQEAGRRQKAHVPTLLTLPPELRNRIWELCIGDTTSIRKGLQSEDSVILAKGHRLLDVQRTVQQPPLTRVCRQMRSEALPMFYSGRTFLWHRFGRASGVSPYARGDGPGDACAVVRWVKAIGDRNRGWLSRVLLQYEAVDLMKKRDAGRELVEVVGRDGVVDSECLQTAEEYWWEIGVGC
ncbi:hypothetical protein LTR91_014067 [Friedmanniomyces endolithicus]|uniref:2EXR domain-containing protein n=1 Tax=Friedmanniomyces endolithicus TaxID=329885 RepID=A0AAN6KCN4_9PEZI|nr:hypothetical protein LTR94_013193 [Friedmanniomyces endolithicus]KAK0783757.1 hypothetical protein LTR59_011643 [Friedmanniomyces endolithicus]KAK0791163.1 hypothetical protein LTR38_010356 [Friedmanniomyces endolithicus]KAK0803282.1 hypothetical protein LTR75_008038 [Friedmanniomyces endolithicus]KAK0842431.1 hypothetical protein LTR03_009313 [Friedmanniomyces endolithicus]